MDQLELSLRERIRELRKFKGFLDEFEVIYAEIKEILSQYDEKIESVQLSDPSSEQHRKHYLELHPYPCNLFSKYRRIQRELNNTAIEVKSRIKLEQKEKDHKELFLHASLRSMKKETTGSDPAAMLGNEITNSLKRMMKTMQEEIERSSINYEITGIHIL